MEQPPVELVLEYSHLAHFVLLIDVELDPLLGQRTRWTGFEPLGLERLLFLDVVQVLKMDLLCFKHVQRLNYVLIVVLVSSFTRLISDRILLLKTASVYCGKVNFV